MVNQREPLNSLNPTGTIHGDYSPEARASAPLEPDITTLSETMNLPPDALITIYRGVPKNTTQAINPGDFVTTNAQLARDYAGTGAVIEKQVPVSHVLDSRTEPLGEEYIYRPQNKRRIGRVDVAKGVSERAIRIAVSESGKPIPTRSAPSRG